MTESSGPPSVPYPTASSTSRGERTAGHDRTSADFTAGEIVRRWAGASTSPRPGPAVTRSRRPAR
ncbi:hypothetical protein ACFPM0_13750 [Pseudonocardia sulfidoxydans]|uniref:hypothetical protein n=1 Tax=Pseudonocardia sulfidoxydans TaxID=54011 RepID=UPI0036083EED